MALCANDGTLCDFRISDSDGDGVITSLDISGVVAVGNGDAPTSAPMCGGLNVNVFD